MHLGKRGRAHQLGWKRIGVGVIGLLALGALGCSSNEAGGGQSAQEPVAQNVQALVDQRLNLSGNEPHLAVDPTNSLNVAVAQYTTVSLSTDGGRTFPVSVNVTLPAGFNLGRGGDPVLAYDSQGRLFFSFLATENTSSAIDVFIQEIDHANGTAIGTALNVSNQAGVGAGMAGNDNDKQWLAIDRFAGSPFQDRLYMIWTNFRPAGVLIHTSFSTDGGATWSAAQTLNVAAEGFPWPPHIAVAPNGDVYAAYHADANDEILLVRSPFDSLTNSGGNFDLTTKQAVFPAGSANLTFNVQGFPPNLDRNQSWLQGSHQPFILPDPTDANRVLVVGSDDPTDADHGVGFDDTAVLMTTTVNRGVNWTAPAQIDGGPGNSHQLFPMGAFDFNTQCLSVAYYDSRNGATNANGNFLLDMFVRVSPDSGATWGPEVQINDLPFDPDMLAPDRFPPSQTFRIGEYNGLAHAFGIAWTGNDPNDLPPNQNQQIIFDYSDGIAPSFTFVPPNVQAQGCGAVDIGTATAVDNQCGIGGVVVTNDAPATFPLGTTVVTWTAVDAADNFVTATQVVTVTGTLGDDPSCCPAGSNVILGTPNNDNLIGSAGSDCILGFGSQDTINGLGGADFISGGEGNDSISGGDGDDSLSGGNGQDTLNGGDGSDLMNGGGGDDTLNGGIGDDTLIGEQGQDKLNGENGNDTLFGTQGDDTLNGGDGNDDLIGGADRDSCNGGAGTNTFAQCEFGAPNSCTDSVQNGTETDVDCGGACGGCANGDTCNIGSDCQSGVCDAGVCAGPPPGPVSTSLNVTADWGGGYCVELDVTNTAATPTTSFAVTLDTNASTIYTSWNGSFSGNSGVLTVTPVSWNQVVDPGETDSSIGFCANRTTPGGTLPTVISTSATF